MPDGEGVSPEAPETASPVRKGTEAEADGHDSDEETCSEVDEKDLVEFQRMSEELEAEISDEIDELHEELEALKKEANAAQERRLELERELQVLLLVEAAAKFDGGGRGQTEAPQAHRHGLKLAEASGAVTVA